MKGKAETGGGIGRNAALCVQLPTGAAVCMENMRRQQRILKMT